MSDWLAYDMVYDLYVINADGSSFEPLLAGPFFGPTTFYSQPAWSTNGARIATVVCAYTYDNCYPSSTIGVLNADGSGLKIVATLAGSGRPTWSPDGKIIAFASRTCSVCTSSIRYVAVDGRSGGLIIANGYSPDWRR